MLLLTAKHMTKDKKNNVDPGLLAEIKKELTERKGQILQDLADIEGGDKENSKVKFPEYGSKSDENAQEIGEYSTNLAQGKVLHDTLRDIEASLARIEDGSYGVCKYCKEPIAEKRLKARPVASACIGCKTKLQSAV